MELIKQREGVNLVTVLSGICNLGPNRTVRQKDIVEEIPLSKGAVSQNIKKLESKGLVFEENGKYGIDNERLLELYRLHLEEYCRRRQVPDKFRVVNKLRSETKHRLNDIFKGEVKEIILKILFNVIEGVGSDRNVNTLNEVFHRVDAIISRLAEAVDKKEISTDIKLIAVAMDRSTDIIEDLEFDFDLNKTATMKMAKNISEEIDNA